MYNTCKNLDIAFTEYGSAVINEYTDRIDFYLNNYDEDAKTTLKTTTIKIFGCKSEPKYSFKDRGVNQAKGSVLFGDRDLTASSVPENLIGAEYIRTACDSKLVTTDLGAMTAGGDITLYAALDSRVTEDLHAWLSTWTKTSDTISTSNDLTLEIFKKNFMSGERIDSAHRRQQCPFYLDCRLSMYFRCVPHSSCPGNRMHKAC